MTGKLLYKSSPFTSDDDELGSPATCVVAAVQKDLTALAHGRELLDGFVEQRIKDSVVNIYERLPRNNCK